MRLCNTVTRLNVSRDIYNKRVLLGVLFIHLENLPTIAKASLGIGMCSHLIEFDLSSASNTIYIHCIIKSLVIYFSTSDWLGMAIFRFTMAIFRLPWLYLYWNGNTLSVVI